MGKKIKGWIIRDKEFCKSLSLNKTLDMFKGTAKFISWNKHKMYIIFLEAQSNAEVLDTWADATSIKHAEKSHAKNLAGIKKRREWTNPNLTPSRLRGVFKDSALKTLEDFKEELSESEPEEYREENTRKYAKMRELGLV